MALASVSRPAPTLGWVTNKNIGAMQAGEALSMDNYFPRANTVDLINGYLSFADTLSGAPVESLMVWNGGQSSVMLAASGGSIYDASFPTSGGAFDASFDSSFDIANEATLLDSGLTNNRWQYTNFGNAGGQYINFVNGFDNYRYFDGTTISTASISSTDGLTSDQFIHIHAFKGRLFFTVKNSLSFAFLGLGEIQGEVSLFDLSKFAKKGGYLVSMGTWTRDGGSGMDDFAVFITSEGEVFIYQGSDPSAVDDWSLVGIFNVGKPIGRRCMENYQNDLAIITYDGVIPLSKVLSLDRQNIAAVSISSNINPTVTKSAQQYGLNFGWEMCVYSKQTMAIVNVPTIVNSQSDQFVVNTDTGAWCKFVGMNAQCWAVFENNLYFGGSDGIVYIADYGDSFNGQPIVGSFQCAYDYFGNLGLNKQYQMIRPTLITSGSLNFSYGLDVDFDNKPYYGSGAAGDSISVTQWGSMWGSPWSASQGITQKWISGSRLGRCAAFKFKTSTINRRISLQSIDWAWSTMGKF